MRSKFLSGILFTFFVSVPLFAQVPQSVTCPIGLTAGGPAGIYTVVLDSSPGATSQAARAAALGSVTVTPDSANTAVVTVPASFSVSSQTFTFLVTPVGAGNADVGVTVNGSRLDCRVTVAAAVVPPPVPTSSPTLGTAGMVFLVGILAMAGFFVTRRM